MTFLKDEIIYKRFVNKNSIIEIQTKFKENFIDNESDYNWLYNNLNDDNSKKVLKEILCYRILGHNKYKLSLDNDYYWEQRKLIDSNKRIVKPTSQVQINNDLYKFNLHFLDYDIDLFSSIIGVQATFGVTQYHYKEGAVEVCAEKNDVVIDAGACYGDTSLYFASKVGEMGKVFSFEFISSNIEVFKKNIDLNPRYKKNIILCNQPISNVKDIMFFYRDYGPGSAIVEDMPNEYDGTATAITIDDFVKRNRDVKIDLIKMDIEGSELQALIGAENVIRKDKPKLAISVYHKPEDLFKIPQWIDSLRLGYKFYLGHYTTYNQETILFAKS